MTDTPRLIEFAFPLKQTSLDSVHEKNVRHGHISTLHIWPARRPLAACRAALIATLLPDPGTPEKRRELCEKIAGTVVKRIETKKMPGGQIVEREKEETEGGILHWGRETENAETLEWFRQEIRKAYGGRAPKVLDPFAGGGAIPLEAMRLGCEATAIDINPVAWFILKCTLEYPQKLAGQKRPLPDFIRQNKDFMDAFMKSQRATRGSADTGTRRKKSSPRLRVSESPGLFPEEPIPDADLAWHVRAWGQWVLEQARRELAKYYPVYADFEPLEKDKKSYERQPMRLVPLKDDGTPDIDSLNAEFGEDYLAVKSNPRWVAKPTVAYLWARTVTCKNCRATIPLLKTRWLCKKDRKRVLLTMEPSAEQAGVVFDIERDVPANGGNAAQRREHDKRISAGTMSRAGSRCPCCTTIMTMEDIRLEGQSGRLGSHCFATVVEGACGKEYRTPSHDELEAAVAATKASEALNDVLPYGIPSESIPQGASRAGGGSPFTVHIYGLTHWGKVMTPRQIAALGTLVLSSREVPQLLRAHGAPSVWSEALVSYLACTLSRTVDYLSTQCVWENSAEEVKHAFMRWALPITWDYAEANPLAPIDRFYSGGLHSTARVLTNLFRNNWSETCAPLVLNRSAISAGVTSLDLVVTDPPYYDAIPYSDLMDFFHLWLRRTLTGISPSFNEAFSKPLGPKWDPEKNDGELIDDRSRHIATGKDSREVYEDGMARAFSACRSALSETGRMVIVFANKNPEAWETLAASVIRSGFRVVSSWPIATEMPGGLRNLNRASLASSIWLVCSPRPSSAKAGWDNTVLNDMRQSVRHRLREFWDAGIRGPDFVWAATGPALEAYSKHPVVKMADDPGKTLTVSEFLNHARRMVVDFVVGRVLSRDSSAGHPHPGPLPEGEGEEAAIDRLDETTAYYLLHRNDFGLEEAPVGACILYATACGLSDQELVRDWDLLVKAGDAGTRGRGDAGMDDFTASPGHRVAASELEEDDDYQDDADEGGTGGSRVKLKTWNHRRGRSLGLEAPGGRPVPLIDRIHRLLHLWKGGDLHKVDEYLDEHALRRNELFSRVLQSLIELAKAGSEERSLLESLSNHIGAKGAKRHDPQKTFAALSATERGEGA